VQWWLILSVLVLSSADLIVRLARPFRAAAFESPGRCGPLSHARKRVRSQATATRASVCPPAMLGPLLLLSTLLLLQPDWSLYHNSVQIHAQVRDVAERNSGAAQARRAGLLPAASALPRDSSAHHAAETSAAAASLGHKSWLHVRWAHVGPTPTEVFGSSGSLDEPGETPVQLFAAGSPHGPRAAQKLDLPDTPAAELLRSLLLTTATTEDNTLESTATAPASVFGGTGSGSGGGGALDPLRVLFNFGEHGREIISSEVALQLVHMLDMEAQQALKPPPPTLADAAADEAEAAAMAAADPASHPAGTRELDPLFTAWLLSHARMVLLPLLNVWSHQRVEEGELCQRKNKRQVDLNRNWDFLWDGLPPSSSSTTNPGDIKRRQQRRVRNSNPDDEQYGGTEPFSEVESRVLRDVALQVRPNLFVNVHSGITEMYCGWDWKQELIPNGAEALRLLQAMRPHCASKSSDCPIGGAGIIGGYVVFGGSMDYLYTQLNTSHSLTIEVFGGERGVDPRECFAYFNPTTAARLEHTKRRWARALIEAVAFLVAEKKDVEFPWKKERWMVGQRAVQRELQQVTAIANPEKVGASIAVAATGLQNFYSRFDELVARFDGAAGVQQLRLPSSISLSPFELLSPSDSAADAEAETVPTASKSSGGWSSLLFGDNDGKPSPTGVLLRARPRWNDACTPFLPGLPRAVVGALESRAQAQQQQQQRRTPPTHMSQWLLPAWTMPTPSAAVAALPSEQQPTINVLLIGGAAWNDLLSTELLCTWVEEAAASVASSASSSSSKQQLPPSVKLFLLPSLFASARMTLLETPPLHAGLCSATLSADHRASLLAHQLYATEALLTLMQEVVRPQIVVLLEADRFVVPEKHSTTAADSTSSDGEPPTAARSLMHVEAMTLQQDAALLSAVASAAATVRARAGDAYASWSVSSRAQVFEAREATDMQRQQGQCAIGRIDVLELLLRQPASLCPSCQVLFRVHMHGVLGSEPTVAASLTSVAPAIAPGGVSPPTAVLNAELAEVVAAEQEARQRAVRAKDDRVAPDIYLRSAAAGADDASAPSSFSPERSVRIAQFASERASSSSSSQQQHWCDFHTRNVAPHSPHNVLALHVGQSKGVWASLQEAINDLVASGALMTATPAPPVAVTAAPVRPAFVGVEEPAVALLAADDDDRDSTLVSRTSASSNSRNSSSSSSHTLQLIRLEDGAGFAAHSGSAGGLLASLALPSLLSLLLLGVGVLATLAFVLVRRRRRQRRHSGATPTPTVAVTPGGTGGGATAKRGALGAAATAAAAAAGRGYGMRISSP
jgi:hypothetical protein